MKTRSPIPVARKYPANPANMQWQLARIRFHCRTDSPMMRIPPIAAMECELVLHAYYGGRWPMAFQLLKKAAWLSWHGLRFQLLLWIADTVGWTKLYDFPETATMRGYKMRHGRKCSGSPNCSNMWCIEESIPRWFRVLTRWDTEYT